MEKAELVHKSKAKGATTKPPAVSADKAPPGKVVKAGGPSKKVGKPQGTLHVVSVVNNVWTIFHENFVGLNLI